MFRRPTYLLLSMLLISCASAGSKIDPTHIDDVQNGRQSKSEIRTWFGEPYSMTTGLQAHPSGCVERWTFEFAKARGFGTVTYQEMLVIDFDDEGMVCDHAFSKSGKE